MWASPYNNYLGRIDHSPQFPTYTQPVGQMPIQQPIQNISQVMQKSAMCYFVSDIKDMERIQPNLNVVYVGLNDKTKEIYLKQLNNSGLIECKTYALTSNSEEKNELATILDKLSVIENSLTKEKTNEQNVRTSYSTNNGRTISEQPSNASFQSNDVWQNANRTNTNFNQPCEIQRS